VVEVIAGAQRFLAKGARLATAAEKEAMRRWLAGDLPCAGGEEASRVRATERAVGLHVRDAQATAAQLRAAWQEAGKEEMARRASREGGREGTAWRGVGWEAWRQSVHVLSVQDAAGDQADAGPAGPAADAGTGGVCEGGWTMAAALIGYLKRKRARQARRARAPAHAGGSAGAVADDRGRGVVLFDVETTALIDEGVPLAHMEVAVACAAWVAAEGPAAADLADADTRTFWHVGR